MRGKRSQKVTITSVARLAGVSTATAGRVLGGYGYSSQEVRTRVKESAEALGYRPNRLARSLITGKTKTIGVVAGDIQSPFYAGLLRGIDDVVRGTDFGILLTNSDEQLDREVEAVRLLMEKQVDALIVAPSDLVVSEHLHDIVAAGCPVVQIDRVVKGLPADAVMVDSITASHECTSALIASGHRRVGILAELERWEGGDVDNFINAVTSGSVSRTSLFPSWQRLFGYLRAHMDAGIPLDRALVARVGAYSKPAAEEAVRDLLAVSDGPTAIFSTDGLMSSAVMVVVNEAGLSIPDDLSLVCFDDLDWMTFHQPPISAVVQPVNEMGRAAAKLVLDRIDGLQDEPRHVALAPDFIRRGSILASGSGGSA